MYKSRSVLCLLLFSVFLLMSGCGGDDSTGGSDNPGGDNTPPANNAAPKVSSTTPIHDEPGVNPGTSISATFSEDILETSISGNSLTINLNGQTVAGSISFDGIKTISFTPTDPFALLGHYTAKLATSITDLSGNPLASTYSWAFTVLDGAWGTTELINSEFGRIRNLQVAMDDAGNAIAVWAQSDGTRFSIWANRLSAATGAWESAELIETSAGSASKPYIVMDTSGNAIVAWEQWDGVRQNIAANYYNSATKQWGMATVIGTNDAFDAFAPHIALDASGNAIVMWGDVWMTLPDGITHSSIWINNYNSATGKWDTAELFETYSEYVTSSPTISFDAKGNAIAVWSVSNSTNTSSNMWAIRYLANTDSWGTPKLIENNSGSAYGYQMVMDDAGNTLVVWEQYDGTTTNLWTKRYSGQLGKWETAELLETKAADAFIARIAMDAAGNAIVVWSQYFNSDSHIWAKRYVAKTNTWKTEEIVDTSDSGASNARIVVDIAGNAIILWTEHDGTYFSVWASRYEAYSDHWSTPVLIETNAGYPREYEIAVNDSGEAVAVMQLKIGDYDDDTDFNIWANRFD